MSDATAPVGPGANEPYDAENPDPAIAKFIGARLAALYAQDPETPHSEALQDLIERIEQHEQADTTGSGPA